MSTELKPKTIQIPELLEQPTYNYLAHNVSEVKRQLRKRLSAMTDAQIILGIASQANKGLTKYGKLIDDNTDFDADTYCNEEIFDALVYQAYKEVQNNNNQ